MSKMLNVKNNHHFHLFQKTQYFHFIFDLKSENFAFFEMK